MRPHFISNGENVGSSTVSYGVGLEVGQGISTWILLEALSETDIPSITYGVLPEYRRNDLVIPHR